MVYAQDSWGFPAGVLFLFATAGYLRRRRSRTDNRVACSTEDIGKDSSVHTDGVYDYDEECLRRRKAI